MFQPKSVSDTDPIVQAWIRQTSPQPMPQKAVAEVKKAANKVFRAKQCPWPLTLALCVASVVIGFICGLLA